MDSHRGPVFKDWLPPKSGGSCWGPTLQTTSTGPALSWAIPGRGQPLWLRSCHTAGFSELGLDQESGEPPSAVIKSLEATSLLFPPHSRELGQDSPVDMPWARGGRPALRQAAGSALWQLGTSG